jgi:ABC-type multidrug transport system fused ATPase/permease subunit
MRIFQRLAKSSTILKCARVLSKSEQRKIVLVIGIQLFLSVLDLIGVAIVGILGALAVRGVQSQQPGDRVSMVLRFLQIEDLSFQNQMVVLGLLAACLLIARTIASIYLNRKTLFFLSRRGATISARLTSQLLSQSLLKVQDRTNQLTLFSLTNGVEIVVLKILGTAVTLVSDLSLLAVMVIGLFIVDPTIAISSILLFGLIGLALYKLMHKRAHTLGLAQHNYLIKTNEKVIEVLNSYRESTVRNRRNYYAREIGNLRLKMADTSAEMTFMPSISKYVMETTVVIGALVIAGIQFMMKDAVQAVATLSIFLAAGTRIAPAALRLQQGAVQIKEASGSASSTLALIEELRLIEIDKDNPDILNLDHQGFTPEISIKDACLTYPNKDIPSVQDLNLQIPAGSSLAFVGPSGAGKTTIVDMILGVLSPDQGSIQISGYSPLESIKRWPGAISYVPQDVMISNGTIRENVALGYPLEVATDQLMYAALEIADLVDFVKSLPKGLDTEVGERGTKISGGQRQRLGIARAMFTNPSLLVLDEATSSLDGETELKVSDAIKGLGGETTVILIAHRLSTVKDVDIVVYMAEGRIKAVGKFEEVRNKVSDFDRQAQLMGL